MQEERTEWKGGREGDGGIRSTSVWHMGIV